MNFFKSTDEFRRSDILKTLSLYIHEHGLKTSSLSCFYKYFIKIFIVFHNQGLHKKDVLFKTMYSYCCYSIEMPLVYILTTCLAIFISFVFLMLIFSTPIGHGYYEVKMRKFYVNCLAF